MTSHPALRFELPGQWRQLPMAADAELSAAIAEFVREHFGRRDDQSTLRAQQRARLGGAAQRARDAGATQFHLSLKGPGGIAFASTLAEYRPRLPLGDSAEPALLADRLLSVLRADDAAGPFADGSTDAAWAAFVASGGALFERSGGLVLRRERLAEASDPRDPPAAIADYWLTEPGHARVVLVTFTTALAELAPLMTELFDAVVGAAEWTAADCAGGLRAELGLGG
jgi:hypothetical protein